MSALATAMPAAPMTLAAFDALTASAHGPGAHVIELHPQLAGRLLRRNTHNRALRSTAVDDYARDIEAGTWPLNGEAIKFDTHGNVLDGQHRLHAVVKAKKPVQTFIITGLPAETQTTMDSGRRRTTADALSLAAETNATTVAAILGRLWAWEQGDRKFTRRTRPTTAESQNLLAAHPQIRRSAEVAQRTHTAFPHIPPSALGTAHHLLTAIDPAATAWFFQRLGDGAELPTGPPILALRTRVTSERAKEGRIDWARHLAYLIVTWNAYRDGRNLSRLVLRPGNPVPTPK
ncbi:hypothetical protein ACIQCR_31635 [Streptomyces sp. NPDC093249]|uniref:hypothetical protein n=1 Tax=unclassified Streptomyces TaxID=2593676 RepID=UPI00382B0AE8